MKVVLNLKWQDLSKSEHNVVFPLKFRMTCVRILKHKKFSILKDLFSLIILTME